MSALQRDDAAAEQPVSTRIGCWSNYLNCDRADVIDSREVLNFRATTLASVWSGRPLLAAQTSAWTDLTLPHGTANWRSEIDR